MDIDALLQNFGEDNPSGEDLEYDPAFADLEIAAQPGEERQAGDEIIAGTEPDYKDVSQKALVVLERSHDLRAAVLLAQAQLNLNGFPGFSKATTYINRCLDSYWESCHPQLDEEDDNDPTMRVNAILSLADPNTFLKSLRKAPLTNSRIFGGVSLRDIAVAEGEITAPSDMENVPDVAGISAAFQDTDEEKLREIAEAVTTALADVEAINAKFDAETPGQGPDLDPLIKLLKQATSRVSGALGEPVANTDASEESEATEGSVPAPPRSGGASGAINTPEDVQNALDRIVAYYQRSEPSSPVPILLMRAKKLVSADFLTIVKDLAPGGVDNVNLIGGLEVEDEY